MDDRNDNALLTPDEAAIYLGVTRELIFKYTKNNFAKGFNKLPLKSESINGRTLFRLSMLDTFDLQLREKWSDNAKTRSSIPTCIRDHLIAESFNECSRCGTGNGIESAHIIPWSESLSHHPSNLIRICSSCHIEHDINNSLSTKELQRLKEQLIARTRRNIKTKLRTSAAFPIPQTCKNFVGRKEELEKLKSCIQSNESIAIVGVGGIGKSELVKEALKKQHTYKQTVWVNVEKYTDTKSIISSLNTELNINLPDVSILDIATCLDEIQACIVFDGIEQIGSNELESLEDFLSELSLSTKSTQFIITSQVKLLCFIPDKEICVFKLNSEESSTLFHLDFKHPFRKDDFVELIEFCNGHPLAIKIATSIAKFYRSPDAALDAIKEKSFNIPTRSNLNKSTSLEVCLAVAYDALNDESRKLLWILSELPNGIFEIYIDSHYLNIDSVEESFAYLKLWTLVEPIYKFKSFNRIGVLTPIRHFVRNKSYSKENLHELEKVFLNLAELHSVWLAATEYANREPERFGVYLSRINQELDNLLNFILTTCEKFRHQTLVDAAISIGMTIMKYFFVSNEPQRGGLMLAQLIKLSEEAKVFTGVATLLAQFLNLAIRSSNTEMIAEGKGYIDSFNAVIAEPEKYPELFLAKAMAESEPNNIEKYALQACEAYKSMIAQESHPNERINDLNNGLSDALGILASAHLEQNKILEAKSTYLQVLELCNGSHIALNRGQTLHQLANCEAYLENDAGAIELYLEAASIFEDVGMAEYIGNSICEIGYCYLNLKKIPHIPKKVDLEFALDDLYIEFKQLFEKNKLFDHHYSGNLIRKLAGVHYVFTLTGKSENLENIFDKLFEQQLIPLLKKTSDANLREKINFSVSALYFVLVSGLLAAKAEKEKSNAGKASLETISQLFNLFVEYPTSNWLRDVTRIYEWLYLFLTHNLKINKQVVVRLIEFIKNNDSGLIHDEIDLQELFVGY